MKRVLEKWNHKYFNGELSPAVLEHLAKLNLSDRNPKARNFVERMFKFMQTACFRPTDFTDELAKQLHEILNVTEGVWDGSVLPFTVENRHYKIDEYIERNSWLETNGQDLLLDLGCGFPPVTTSETANRLSNWCVVGADPSIPQYIVYNEKDDYATFNALKELQFFQGGSGRSLDIWQDPETTKAHFAGLLSELLPQLPDNGQDQISMIQNNSAKLVKNPIRAYERANLRFFRVGVGDVDVRNVSVIRCFNVLFYFDNDFRKGALQLFADILRHGGLAMVGVNGDNSTRCRYTIFRKEGKRLLAKEFAFSIDNVRPLGGVSWAAFHKDEPEITLLMNSVRILRNHPDFRRDFDARYDELLVKHQLYCRDDDGYLVSLDTNLTPKERETRRAEVGEQLVREGFVYRAAKVLKDAGYEAWSNCVGHVAVTPSAL